MLTRISKGLVVMFGLFLIGVGILMLFAPKKAQSVLRKAGSTNLINYAEITIRMIPAAALVLYAEYSKTPGLLKLLGWFMLGTSVVLYFVPRKYHHAYALKWANILKPLYFQLIAPFSILFGIAILYTSW